MLSSHVEIFYPLTGNIVHEENKPQELKIHAQRNEIKDEKPKVNRKDTKEVTDQSKELKKIETKRGHAKKDNTLEQERKQSEGDKNHCHILQDQSKKEEEETDKEYDARNGKYHMWRKQQQQKQKAGDANNMTIDELDTVAKEAIEYADDQEGDEVTKKEDMDKEMKKENDVKSTRNVENNIHALDDQAHFLNEEKNFQKEQMDYLKRR